MANVWHYDDFTGTFGDSDLAGDVSVDTGRERPFLRAKLLSRRLDFDDLAGFVGASPKAARQRRRDAEAGKRCGAPGRARPRCCRTPRTSSRACARWTPTCTGWRPHQFAEAAARRHGCASHARQWTVAPRSRSTSASLAATSAPTIRMDARPGHPHPRRHHRARPRPAQAAAHQQTGARTRSAGSAARSWRPRQFGREDVRAPPTATSRSAWVAARSATW